ncbi:unnamed protein product [Prorocentrum cordatum]|uniref:Uncharacterized protein n=1 Tax=Prorocentrum cordatum TaxID=2364126 RepID=A0ABN9T542_9DINO|nr:unnamed protein product [Polarella glacialis]
MGGGASSAHGGAKTRGDDNSTTCGTDAGSSGICQQWLMATIEKERQEKEWLAHKYDERCTEVLALQEEVRALRAIKARAARAEAPRLASPREDAAPAVSPGLAQRRSLTLNVQTGKRTTSGKLVPDPPDDVDETDKAPPQLTVLTTSTTADDAEAEAFAATVSQSSYDFRGPTKDGQDVVKTKSQLLRRRTEHGAPEAAAAAPASRSSSADRADLEITASDKIFSMVDNPEEEPISPKRTSGGRRKPNGFTEDLRDEEL